MHLLVLSAFRRADAGLGLRYTRGLNAPFGAQCFPTIGSRECEVCLSGSQCTFWCSVLSDMFQRLKNAPFLVSQCTFWCSVLSDRIMQAAGDWAMPESQCTFWCSVLSDLKSLAKNGMPTGLNAPFGAQCFPTGPGPWFAAGSGRLNAPFGAQCFPTLTCRRSRAGLQSQCTFWCSVLSDG